MPLAISTRRMKKVLRKLAVPPAKELITELMSISLAPLTRLETPENSFLRIRAMETEDPTAAV
jgi:hypothetical protein